MNSREIALKGLQSIHRILLADLDALPEEAYTRRFGPKTRSVADIMYEVALVNTHVAGAMRGEEPFPWPEGGWILAPEDCQTKAAVTDRFSSSVEDLIQTVEATDEATWNSPMRTENGETDRFERCRFVTVHMFYHSGQLNFIQTLLGDDAWHWA